MKNLFRTLLHTTDHRGEQITFFFAIVMDTRNRITFLENCTINILILATVVRRANPETDGTSAEGICSVFRVSTSRFLNRQKLDFAFREGTICSTIV